ncbi:hypothetical protein KXW98_002532 [Aspergillus fumigatus]|nr:hypothetical protein KXX45_001390 [Aspergillus fumigatus]KAH1356692.1 hypothetical protein KXX33_007161 [Aspergillus fumigatus]KAH1380430.1 hypothetical protein KXX49_006410 [Aspergillus fumigatus]KAH1386756.1 hypothetical protein KXX50_004033 [Aspergillus fumigatus]KAH1386883.1 hypothetical protein KXX10_003602 [Aspergillus fumigatus]
MCQAWTLPGGYRAAALVRDGSKLRKILSVLGVSSEIVESQLIITEDSSRDVKTVVRLLRSDPDLIFSGVTSLPKFSINPLRPIGMQDATIIGDSAIALIDALRELRSTGGLSNAPLYIPISSVGHSSQRDQPLLSIPLYLWLLPIAQEDTAVLEKVVRKAATEANSPLGGYVMLRPPLLTHGKMKGRESVRVGWIWEDEAFKNQDEEEEEGIKIKWTISRLDLAKWMFEELVQGDAHKWKGKCVYLTY